MGIAKYKTAVQHCDTFQDNVGAGTIPQTMVVLETEGGSRSVSGAQVTIKDFATTGETINVGDIVKYINLFLQITPRISVGVDNNKIGWLEWGIVMVKESETTVPITQLGVLTLANVLTNMFRNECIYTGAVAVGLQQANYAEIKIKVPKFKQKIRLGDEWRFVTAWRSSNATDTTTDTMRLVKSFMYKSYS